MIHVLHRNAWYPETASGSIQVPEGRNDIEFRAQFMEPASIDVIHDSLEHDFYEHVADVDAQVLEGAFANTQHIEENWLGNPVVTAKVDRARSTSMGDILMDDAGRCHVVVMVGFHEIENHEIVARLRELVR